MASHKSAEKRARQTKRRTAVNTARRSRVRGSIKKVEEAIKAGDKKAAADALRAA
jgi:small subunit ribosomal protein S20